MEIPKIIHQIWIGPDPVPLYWINTFRVEFLSSNPDWMYKMWTEDNIAPIIYNMPVPVKDLYNRIPNEPRYYCHKADILRLVILKLYGGVYIDADSSWLVGRKLDILVDGLFVCAKEPSSDFYANGVIGCVKNHPFLDMILFEMINITNYSYLTLGPGPFSKIVNQNLDKVKVLDPNILYPEGWHGQSGSSTDKILLNYKDSIMYQHGYTTNNLFLSNETKTVSKNNHEFIVNDHWFWNMLPTWEDGTFKVFDKYAVNKNVIDIGAWIGFTSLYLSKISKRVIAIEPNPTEYNRMVANIKLNNCNNIHTINRALCHTDDEIDMHFNDSSSSSVLCNRGATGKINGITIDSLEQRIKNIGIDRVEFVKMDIEGGEKIVVPLIIDFLVKNKSNLFISLHPLFITNTEIKTILDILDKNFDKLLEVDMVTPFDINKDKFDYGEHNGCDVLCLFL